MKNYITPNFRGWRALIVHSQSESVERLTRQLTRLGLDCEQMWPEVFQTPNADVIFFDGDNGYDGIFPWVNGEAPMPMIALLGSEAPGRLEWVLQQGVSAHLLKPIGSGGAFSALVIAVTNFNRQRLLTHEIAELKNRAQMRPIVVRTIISIMKKHQLDEDAAFSFIRKEAMQRRQSIENLCATNYFENDTFFMSQDQPNNKIK